MAAHGTFEWYELVTNDPAGAQRFYADVIGWTAEDSGHPDMRYMLFKTGGVPVAGLMEAPAALRERGVPPFWLGYVAVDDVDAGTALARSLGATVHREPTDIPDIGRFAVILDPQQATIVLFKRDIAVPIAPLSGQPGHAGWHELLADDMEGAFAFYAKLFGWTKAETVDIGPMGPYQLFAVHGTTIGGMMNKPPQRPDAPQWTYYFQADGARAAAERIEKAGGTVIFQPMQVPGGSWIVQALDPQGATFALVSMVE